MSNFLDDEPTILTRLMPNLQQLQHDSRGLMQWLVTLNDQEWLTLIHWAPQQAPWLVPALRRIPRNATGAPEATEREREVGA